MEHMIKDPPKPYSLENVESMPNNHTGEGPLNSNEKWGPISIL
jgi:hypothetical protein